MKPLRVSIVGAGKRVIETALPALRAASESFAIHGVFARRERALPLDEATALPVRTLESFSDSDLAATDVFYVAVGKGSIGAVLAALTRFPVSDKTLWIDTPVLLWKQLRHLEKLARFKKAEVPEDCIALPWYDVVLEFRRRRGLGPPRGVTFVQSAYKYHGLAMAKTLLEDDRIVSGSVKRGAGERAERTLRFARGGVAQVHEPRDYSLGFTSLRWDDVVATDAAPGRLSAALPVVRIEMEFDGDRVAGFVLGDAASELDAAERGLQLCRGADLSLTARMEDWKRIGFLRLLRRLARGEPGYPALAGIDDSLVDWQLDKLGRYRRNPFTTIDRASARVVLGAVSRIVG